MVKMNVKLLRYKDAGTAYVQGESKVLTYEHTEWLPEGTTVVVDVSGYLVVGEIVFDGHAYDGACKRILDVLAMSIPVVVV